MYSTRAFQNQPTFRGPQGVCPTTNHVSWTFLSPYQEPETYPAWHLPAHCYKAKNDKEQILSQAVSQVVSAPFPTLVLIGISPEKLLVAAGPFLMLHPPLIHLYLPSSFHFLFRSNSKSFSSPQSSMVHKLQNRQSDSHMQGFPFSSPRRHILVL